MAVFPVDPRQGSLYDAGALYFLMSVKPQLLIPMHYQGRADVVQDFARKNRSRRTNIVALTRRGESIFYGEADETEPEDTATEIEETPVVPNLTFDAAQQDAAQNEEEMTDEPTDEQAEPETV